MTAGAALSLSRRYAQALISLDFSGIICLIVGSYFPIIYYGFHDMPAYVALYLGAVGATGAALVVVAQLSFFEAWRWTRVCLLLGLGLFGVVPLTHLLFHHRFSALACNLWLGVGQMGLCYLVGVAFFATGFPERSLFGKRWSLDMYGSSHTVWHVFVVAAAALHYKAVLELWHSTGHSIAHASALSAVAVVQG